MLEVSWFVCGVLYFILYSYLFCELVIKDKFKINIKIILFSMFIGIVYYFISKFNLIYLRPYIIHVYFFFTFKLIFKERFSKILIGIFCLLILSCLAEVIFGFIMVILLKINIIEFNDFYLGYLFSNLLILVLSLILSKIDIIRKILIGIINWYNINEFKRLALFVIMSVIIVTFLLYNNFIEILPKSFLTLTNLFCICVMVFVIGFFKEKSNNNRIITEYDQLLNYVKIYENTVEEKSKNQHEYKNQLLIVKGLINSKNKKALEYIDLLLNNENNIENVECLNKLKYVPQGGLKGLIYYKIQEMLKKDIDVFVNISPQLEKVKNNKYLNQHLEEISKIIGVYLDNAIEAVKELNNKYIVIDFYLEGKNIIFSLSNNYKGSIDVSKLDKEGYTTKGYSHGYGLSLVKDIISKNDRLDQKRELNGIYYVQKLYINIKK